MNAPVNFQTILDANGKPVFVVLPSDEFQRLTQADVAAHTGISQAD